jgi:DNA polymerase-3 subunit beta
VEQEKVTLTQKDNLLELKAERLKTTFPTISAEEFPKLFEEKGLKRGEFDKKLLDKELSKIVFAAATDAGRPALSGILIKGQLNKKNLILVATDGYRLSLKEGLSATSGNDQFDSSYIVPARVIRELFSVKTNGNMEFYTSEKSNQVIFDTAETTVIGRLIDATYPDYEKIIPDEFATTVEFDRGSALSAVRQCSVFAREAANIIKMSIFKDKIIFSASASSVGENEVEIEAKTTGEENEIAFNSRYLVDFMSNIDEDNIVFQMNGPLNSGVFRIKGVDSFLHLIMPIKINS